MLRIIQVIHTFVVEADDLRKAHGLVSDSIEVDPAPGVTVAQRQLKAGDPFELSQPDPLAKRA